MKKTSRYFVERQIFVRTARGVRFVRLSPALQQVGAGCIALMLGAAAWLPVSQAIERHLASMRTAEVKSTDGSEQRVLAAAEEWAGPSPGMPHNAVFARSSDVMPPPRDRIQELEHRLAESEAARNRLVAERDRLEAERRRLAAAEKRLNGTLASQQETIQKLIDRARTAIERATRKVSSLGIDPKRLLATGKTQHGAGGPFIEYRRAARGQPLHDDLVTLGEKLTTLTKLRTAMDALPLGAPLERYQLASSFGVRRDPFNSELAVHNGVDLAAPRGTEIKVRAPGRVIHAGRNGVYGNFIEVDHGFGVRTRYGHLSKIFVRPGQKVAARDTIGLVGSTGRSTAPHLHYEVLFKGKILDPRKFVEARKHVREK